MNLFNYPMFLNVYYNVKYSQKELAKTRRLRWDSDKKKWYSKHELYNFHNGDDWIDLDGVCIVFDIIDFKITNGLYNDINHSEYNNRIDIFKSLVMKQYNKLKNKQLEKDNDEELDDEEYRNL